MKAKSFHCSKSGVVQPLAATIGTNLQCVCDKMPPAYPCDKEKVVFVGIEMDGALPKPVEQFCKDLNTSRTQAVAFYIVNSKGTTNGLEATIKKLKEKGIFVVDDILAITVKSSFFKKGQVTESDLSKTLEWATKISKMEF